MTFGQAIALCVRYTFAFLEKGWWLVFVPFVPSILFAIAAIHGVVPKQIYNDLQLLLSFVQTILSVIATYWIIRFFALGQSVRAALAVDRRSISSFAPYAAFFSAFWCGELWLIQRSLEQQSMTTIFLLGALAVCVESLLAPWSVAAPSGSKSIGPIVSLRFGWRKLVWGVALLIVVGVPFEIASNLLGGVGDDTWSQTIAAVSTTAIEAILLVANYAAVFAIASKIGVKTSSENSVKEIFS